MSLVRLYEIDDEDLPMNAHLARDVMKYPQVKHTTERVSDAQSTRKKGESLHDFFKRKGLKCFCTECVVQRQSDSV